MAAVLTAAVAAAVLQRTRTGGRTGGGAPQAQCRAGACSALQAQVEAHVALVHGELQEIVTSLCPTDPPLHVPSPWEQQPGEAGQERNVNVPSCDKLREAGLEAYYGNLNMLLVEAWLAKILPALRRPLQRGKILQVLTLTLTLTLTPTPAPTPILTLTPTLTRTQTLTLTLSRCPRPSSSRYRPTACWAASSSSSSWLAAG